MKKLLVLVILLLFVTEAKAEYFVYGIGENFSWQQSADTGGNRKEQGFIYGIGANGKWNPYSNLTLKIITETTGNRFMASGLDQEVEFLMIKITGDVGWKFDVADSLSVEPYIGFGYRRWVRDVEGYKEFPSYTQIWRSHFGRIGVETRHNFSEALMGYVNLGAIIPTGSRMKKEEGGETNRVDFNSVASGFGEVGVKYKMFRGDIFYEGLRFPAAKDRIEQPKSKADMLGIKLGVAF